MTKHDKLLKKKNVVAVWTGTKKVGGVSTGKKALVIGVTKKMPKEDLGKQDLVPMKINGMETDVVEVGEIKALAVDRTKKFRPAPGGVSIGHFAVTAGTLGAVVKKEGKRFILSANHVLANMNDAKVGDAIYQPGPHDGGLSIKPIAILEDFVPIQFDKGSGCLPLSKVISLIMNFFSRLFGWKSRSLVNTVDCAIARPLKDEDVLDEILDIGIPTGFGETETGKTDIKSGRTTAITQGIVIATDAVVSVNYGGKSATFEDQVLYTAMSQSGDSGSVMVSRAGSVVVSEDNKIVGLLFAGSDVVTIANKISNVIKALGLED